MVPLVITLLAALPIAAASHRDGTLPAPTEHQAQAQAEVAAGARVTEGGDAAFTLTATPKLDFTHFGAV